jgi:hypothetical protein
MIIRFVLIFRRDDEGEVELKKSGSFFRFAEGSKAFGGRPNFQQLRSTLPCSRRRLVGLFVRPSVERILKSDCLSTGLESFTPGAA